MDRGLWLAEDIIIELPLGGPPSIVLPDVPCRLRFGLDAVLLIGELARHHLAGRPVFAQDLGSDSLLPKILDQLTEFRVLEKRSDRPGPRRAAPSMLSPIEWATLRMGQRGGCFTTSLPEGKAAPQRLRPQCGAPAITLPAPELPEGVGLWDTLLSRRSVRTGPERPISLQTLSALLTCSLRIQEVAEDRFGEVSFRPVASGGARHPIEVFAATLRVPELEEGVYHYDPLAHALHRLDCIARPLVAAASASLPSQPEHSPAITLLLSAVPSRVACKYEDIALAMVMKDLGCALQQLYVAATGLGLGGCAVGAASQAEIEEALGLEAGREVFIGAFVLW